MYESFVVSWPGEVNPFLAYPKSVTTDHFGPHAAWTCCKTVSLLWRIVLRKHQTIPAYPMVGKITQMWSVALLYLSLAYVESAPVVHDWNSREVLPIKDLAVIHGHEFPHNNFDPPLIVRDDGAQFLSVAMVDSEAWINLALNSFVTFAKHQNISGLTIMTTGADDRLASIFRRLGLFTYDARATVASYPPEFRLEHPLPSWSWGSIIFLRYNAWFEAFRRGIGFCLVDTDVTFNKDVFFARDKNGHFADISIQGDLAAITPKAGHKCKCPLLRDSVVCMCMFSDSCMSILMSGFLL